MFSPKFIIGLLIAILFVHVLLTVNYWYWIYRWFDIPMHFFGGFWVAMVFFWLRQKTRTIADYTQTYAEENPRESAFNRRESALLTIVSCLAFVALVGVLWEFFEFLFDVFLSKSGYTGSLEVLRYGMKDLYTDTLSDLFFGLLGGLTMAAIFQFRKSKVRFSRDNKPE